MRRLVVMILLHYGLLQGAQAAYPYIDDFSSEAKGLVNTPVDAGQVTQIEGYTNKPKESSYRTDELKKKAQDKQMSAKKVLADENASASDKIEAEGIESFKEGRYSNKYRSVYTASKLEKKKFIKKADNITENPIGIVNTVGGAECAATAADTQKEEVPLEEYEVEVSEVVLKQKEYQCEEDTEQIFYCDRKLKVGGCKTKSEDCDSGGIVLSSMTTKDTTWSREGDVITFGTVHNNIWGGHCAEYRSRAEFEIKNIDLINEFMLIEVGFDDYLQIKINDKLVFNGPYGGDKLEVKQIIRQENYGGSGFLSRLFATIKKVDTGNGQHSCELSTDWRQWPNIDLRSFLREGKNVIETKVIVYGLGEFWMRIKARQYCCVEWSEDAWESDCPVQ